MTTNAFTEIDYLAEGRGRVTEQFKNKPVFDAFLKLVMDYLNELQIVYKDLMQLRSINTATGAQLDLIGNIVGQPRTLVNYNAFPYFGFDGATGAEPFGTLSDSTVGGVFRSRLQEEGSSATVDDETYRFIIKARIIANSTRATPQAIIDGLNFITGNTTSRLVEQPNAHVTLEIQNTLTDFQRYFLTGLSSQGSIVPVPISVAVEYVFFEESYFGMYEDPTAQPLAGYSTGYGLAYGEAYGKSTIEGGGYIAELI